MYSIFGQQIMAGSGGEVRCLSEATKFDLLPLEYSRQKCITHLYFQCSKFK